MTPTQTLQINLHRLSAKDQGFARSLLGNRPTEKVLYWIGQLAQRATQEKAAPAQLDGVSGIVALLDRAAQNLKSPALQFTTGTQELRLSIAGPQSRTPGAINVTSLGSFADRTWYGAIDRTSGTFNPSRRVDQTTATAIVAALKAVAVDPAKAATEYGRLTGRCCFCGHRLDGKDAVSTSLGYGPSCAKKWGVAWGKTAAKAFALVA